MRSNRHESLHVYDMFMGIVGLVSICLICFRFTLSDHDEVARMVDWFDTGICCFFLFDFLRNCLRAPDLKRYMLTWGLLDLVSSIPVSSNFRWARVARLIRMFRLVKSLTLIVRAVRRERKSALMIGTMAAAAVTLAICSIGVLHFEKDAPNANIRTASDAIWWSTVTLTSVGYGDYFPVTSCGRLLAGWLMLTGVIMLGAIAGIFADSLRSVSGDSDPVDNDNPRSSSNDEEALLRSLVELRREMNELSASLKQNQPEARSKRNRRTSNAAADLTWSAKASGLGKS